MFSPTFECSLDGLASAVRLRYVVWGHEDPTTATMRYMDDYRLSLDYHADPVYLRMRIECVIEDIERVTVEQAAEKLRLGSYPIPRLVDMADSVR